MNRCVTPLLVGSLFLPLGCGEGDPTGPTPMVTTTSLLDAGQNIEYSEPLAATGGDGRYEWSVLAGALPAGLSLDPFLGEIRGTPTVIETQDFTVQVESGNQTAQQALSITVGVVQVLQPNDLCSDYPAYAVATFEDANLEIAVRASTGGHEDLSCRVISRIEQLAANFANDDIQSLVGIHNLTGLLELFLSWQAISDVSPLSSLTGLTHLELWRNSVTDIGPLSPLTGLTTLLLHENSITDISALS